MAPDSPAANNPPLRSSCPICGSPDIRLSFPRVGYEVHKCRGCSVEFLNPQPDDAALASIYSADYFLGAQSAEAERRVSEMKRATASKYLDVVSRFLHTRTPKLLEIGCGHGDLLCEAQYRRFEVAGLEYSAHATAKANERLGGPFVRTGSVDSVPLASGHYDCVLAADVVEHVRDPLSFMTRIRAALKPGGLVSVITPSLDSLARRLLCKLWMEYKAEHLFYFGRKSIRILLRRSGFTIAAVVANRKVLTLEYLHQHFERFRVPGLTPALWMAHQMAPARLRRQHFYAPASSLLAVAYRGQEEDV